MPAQYDLRQSRSLSILYLCYNQWEILSNSLLDLASGLSSIAVRSVKVIVCDDFSDHDGSASLLHCLQHFPSLSIEIHRNSENLGPGPSRNYLLGFCTTTHFCFVDGDDAISPEAIHEFLQAPGVSDIYQFPVFIGGSMYSCSALPSQRYYWRLVYPWAASAKAAKKMMFTSCSRIISAHFARDHSYCYGLSRRYEDVLPYAICFVYARSITFCREPLVYASYSLASGSRYVKLFYFGYLFQSLCSLWQFGFPPIAVPFLAELTLLSAVSVAVSYLRSFTARQWNAILRK
jgi:glycosyltransferase involved in cell wall biosynthesis